MRSPDGGSPASIAMSIPFHWDAGGHPALSKDPQDGLMPHPRPQPITLSP